jgi:hypothetical protein
VAVADRSSDLTDAVAALSSFATERAKEKPKKEPKITATLRRPSSSEIEEEEMPLAPPAGKTA